ncbi:MAG: CBS domain-containing protein [Acidobacteria bacterium]|nr:CBS domain-containing protein [Acidobacteriota bacterium]
MRTVGQLLAAKGHDVWSTTPDVSVLSALQVMAEKNVGALVVLDGERLAGIFSERDYARRVVLKGKASKDTPVAEIMTRDPFTVKTDQTVGECMGMMTAERIRHLPVVEGERLIGIITIGDVVKDIIKEQSETIFWLEQYITGGR